MFRQYFLPAEPRGDWSPGQPIHKQNTDMRHLIEEFIAYIQAGRLQNTVRTNARAFLKSKIGSVDWQTLTSVEKGRLVSRLSGLYSRIRATGQHGPKYYLADGKRAVIGRWVQDNASGSGAVHYIVGLDERGAELVNKSTIYNGEELSKIVPYKDIRFQDYSDGKELILHSYTELENACLIAREVAFFNLSVDLKRARFRFTMPPRLKGPNAILNIKPTIDDEQINLDFPVTIRGEKRIKLFCNFVTASPDYVVFANNVTFQHVRFGEPVITRCDTRFSQCSFETMATPIQKESGTVTLKKCIDKSAERLKKSIEQDVATRTLTENYRRWYRRHYHLTGEVETESEPETDDDQPEVVGHETPEQGIEKRRKTAEDAGELIDLSHSVEPSGGGETKSNAPPADNNSDGSDDGLITCNRCGRRWDGNAQCYPCISNEDSDAEDSDAEEEQEERVTRSYGVPYQDYPFKRDAVIAAAENALSGITNHGIYLYYKGAYVFEHNSTQAEHARAIEALEEVGLTVAVFRGEEDYDIVPIDESDRRYLEQNCDSCGEDSGTE